MRLEIVEKRWEVKGVDEFKVGGSYVENIF